jgi:hypothetical protein
MIKNYLFIDVDGTVADSYRRFLYAGPEPSRDDKALYLEWLSKVQDRESLMMDEPVPMVIAMVEDLVSCGWEPVFLTSREESWRDVTERWLEEHFNPNVPINLIMRPVGDWRTSGEFKGAVVAKRVKSPSMAIMIDDDPRGDIAEVMKHLGVVHLKPTNCLLEEHL